MDADLLRNLLSYDPLTGKFHWKLRQGTASKGDEAGYVDPLGYVRVRLARKKYFAHRLAWLYVHGHWPAGEVDHINGVKGDNRISNLRDVDHAINQQNRQRPMGENEYRGVYRYGTRWKSHYVAFGKRVHVGSFDTAEEARAAFIAHRVAAGLDPTPA